MEERRKHWMHSSQNNYRNNSCSHPGTHYSRNYNNIYSSDEVKPVSYPNLTTVGTSTRSTYNSDDEAYTGEHPIHHSKSSHSSKYIQSPQDFMIDASNMACCPCPKTCRIILPGKRKPGPLEDLKRWNFFNCFGNFLTLVFLILFAISMLHYLLFSDEVHPQEEQKENITQPLVNQDDVEEDIVAGSELESDDIDKTLEEVQAIEIAMKPIEHQAIEITTEPIEHQAIEIDTKPIEHHFEIHRDRTIHHDLQEQPIEHKHHLVEHYITKHHHASIPTHHTSAAFAHQAPLPHEHTEHHHKTEHHDTIVPHEHTEHHETIVPHEHTEHHHKTEHQDTIVPHEHTEHHHKTELHETIVPQEHTEHHHKTVHHETIVPQEHTEHHFKTELHETIVPPDQPTIVAHEHTKHLHKTEDHDTIVAHEHTEHHDTIAAPTTTHSSSPEETHTTTLHTHNTPPFRPRSKITFPRSAFGFGSDHPPKSWVKFLLYGPHHQ